MRIYHVCECCDQVFKISEAGAHSAHTSPEDLTGSKGEDIMMKEPENGNSIKLGLCDQCSKDVYGSDGGHFIFPSRLH